MTNNHIARARGFALAEVLVATAIAAGLMVAIATGLGGAVRLSSSSTLNEKVVNEAMLISSRLSAGMDDGKTLEGLENWSISRTGYANNSEKSADYIFDTVTATYQERDTHTFQFLIRKSRENE